ncbi:unnamed protein product [Closterium sp. NIES-65]|nr:unnamed protein product [Closterium sp. NIES-65]
MLPRSLADNDLSGPLPPGIGKLPQLQMLRLDGNRLSGPIPSLISALSSLSYLSLASNELTGAIPPQISALQALQYIDAFESTQKQSPLSTYTPLSMIRVLRPPHSDVRNNLLSGAIPPQIGNNYNLNWLFLDVNLLSGSLPDSISALSALVYLIASHNLLSGPLPANIGQLPRLAFLRLKTQLNASLRLKTQLNASLRLKTQLNASLRLKTQLNASLSISNNSLSGPLPPSMSQLKHLQILSVLGASAGGECWGRVLGASAGGECWGRVLGASAGDECWGRVLGASAGGECWGRVLGTSAGGECWGRVLGASAGGECWGRVLGASAGDECWGRVLGASAGGECCSALCAYAVSAGGGGNGENGGNGPVTVCPPPALHGAAESPADAVSAGGVGPSLLPSTGQLNHLQMLDLSRNRLSGAIPDAFADKPALNSIDLSFNALTGPLPPTLSTCGSLYTLDVSSNSLSGAPGTVVSNMPTLSYLNLSQNYFTGLVPRVTDSQQMVSYDISFNYFHGPGLVSDTTPLALPLCKTGFEPGTFSAASNCLVYGVATENSCPTRVGPMSTGELLQVGMGRGEEGSRWVDTQRSVAACLAFCRTNVTRTAANSQCGSLGTCVVEMTGIPLRPSFSCDCFKGTLRSPDGLNCTAIGKA